MKTLLLLLLSLGTAFAEPAAPAQKPATPVATAPLKIKKLARLETKEKYVFTNVEILEKLPDGLYIRLESVTTPRTKVEGGIKNSGTFITDGGTTLIPYESLPYALIKQLGGFNAGEARKAREKRIEDWNAARSQEFMDHGRPGDGKFWPYDPKEDAR